MLFSKEYIDLKMQDAEVRYYPEFLPKESADHYFERLKQSIAWQQDSITIFGKIYLQPRLTALYGRNGLPYTYSNITMHPKKFTKELLIIKEALENLLHISFTSCLLNLYRNGQDSNGWHADDEKELGDKPIIASVSFGAERSFHFKHKIDKTLKTKLTLKHGSLLIMKGNTQKFWLHQIPKSKREIGQRINLTYRIIQQKNRDPSIPALS